MAKLAHEMMLSVRSWGNVNLLKKKTKTHNEIYSIPIKLARIKKIDHIKYGESTELQFSYIAVGKIK